MPLMNHVFVDILDPFCENYKSFKYFCLEFLWDCALFQSKKVYIAQAFMLLIVDISLLHVRSMTPFQV